MTAIKLFVPIRSSPGVSKQFFHDHWRHPHGTWGRGMSGLTGYIQNHRIDTRHLGPDQGAYDGVVEVGLENAVDAAGLGSDPVYVEHLAPDEPSFIDVSMNRFNFMIEDVIQSGPPVSNDAPSGARNWREAEQAVSIKLIQLFSGDADIEWRDDDDLELGQAIGTFRHARATPAPGLHSAAGPDRILGIRQLWWPTYTEFERGISRSRSAWRLLLKRVPGTYSAMFQAERLF